MQIKIKKKMMNIFFLQRKYKEQRAETKEATNKQKKNHKVIYKGY
jgi:hypothetical protein